jgi:hypothetical protein
MTSSTPGAAKAFAAAELAIRTTLAAPAPAPPAWLRAAQRLHRNAVGLDAIAAALSEAGHPPEAVQLAVAAVRSDVRRLGLSWSRVAAR